jgi:hypothetical protein
MVLSSSRTSCYVALTLVGVGSIDPPARTLKTETKRSMKTLERVTLAAVTMAYGGYLIQQALRTRSERLFRLAAGESPYERTHPKPRAIKHA